MAAYEIRIIKSTGAKSLVYACEHFSDVSAVRSAEKLPRDLGETIEVWRGMDCIHRDTKLAQIGLPIGHIDQGRPKLAFR